MTGPELTQVIHTLHDLGFSVEWADMKAEVLLIRALPVRSS